MSGTFDPYVRRPGKGDGIPEGERNATRLVVATVRDRPNVAELLDFLMDEDRPPWDEVYLVGGHVRWTRPATQEEIQAQADFDAGVSVRQVEWERAALLRFLKKYGVPEGWNDGNA